MILVMRFGELWEVPYALPCDLVLPRDFQEEDRNNG